MSGPDFQVTIGNTGTTIVCAADQTILRAAVAAGIDYPYSCASGNCGTCISQLDSGSVSLLPRGDASLTRVQAEAGQTLACRAQPRPMSPSPGLGVGVASRRWIALDRGRITVREGL